MSNTYIINVSEPWFTLIKLNLKIIEGRLNKSNYAKIKNEDIIIFKNNDFMLREHKVTVKNIKNFNNFKEFLALQNNLEKCLPGIDSIDDGVNVYYKYFTEDDENKYGIVAIYFDT